MPRQPETDSRIISALLVHLGRIASGEGMDQRLTPAQWTVLRYFGCANRFSRTLSAFAAFHGTTRGTASQTIRSLETQGYLTRVRSRADGRSARLELTDKARASLPRDPIETLAQATDALPPRVRGQFAKTLQRLLGQVAVESGKCRFGTCASCAHLQELYYCEDRQASYACQYEGEPLDLEELKQLCINFTPGKPAPPRTPGVGAA